MTSLAIQGDYTYFGSTAAVFPLGRVWLIVPLCAVCGGLLGGLFSRILILCLAADRTRGVRKVVVGHPLGFALACGLGGALCGLAGHHSSYGTGYAEASAILHGDDGHLTLLFMPLKFLSTVFSAVSGIPGGIFAPSLSIGAGLGADLHAVFKSIPLGALALIGMASYLAGVVQTPITSFVIVSEMTQDHAMVIPLMVAALIADAASKLVCKDGLYHALAKPFLPLAPPAEPDPEADGGEPH